MNKQLENKIGPVKREITALSKKLEALRSRCEWQSPETAPKDTVIIADTGYPWPVLALWNEAIEQWATTTLECSQFEGKPDCGWVTEYEKELRWWMPVPERQEAK